MLDSVAEGASNVGITSSPKYLFRSVMFIDFSAVS
jgi:hypothetical protein